MRARYALRFKSVFIYIHHLSSIDLFAPLILIHLA